jgi:hypothetical protein
VEHEVPHRGLDRRGRVAVEVDRRHLLSSRSLTNPSVCVVGRF